MSKRLRVTILGCGSSGGVPRIGGPSGDWGACDPANPKNRRTRCSVLAELWPADRAHDPNRVTAVLVDTSPDMAAQLVAAGATRLDAVLYTHEHADQTHGIDDLRQIALAMRQRVPAYMDRFTGEVLTQRFSYLFTQPPGSSYPPVLDARALPACGQGMDVEGPGGALRITPFLCHHGGIDSLGFVFGDRVCAYSPDVAQIAETSWPLIEGAQCWITDCLRERPHPSHANLETALAWLARAKVKRGVLTNLHVDLDYERLDAITPAHVEPAYDGMRLEYALEA